jgi:hypothetical protein
MSMSTNVGISITGDGQYLTTLTGSQISSATFTASASESHSFWWGASFNAGAVLVVYYTGTPVTQESSAINLMAPLFYDQSSNELGINLPFDVAIDAGTATDYSVSDMNYAQETAGMEIKFFPSNTNTTTTPTLTFNGKWADLLGRGSNSLCLGDVVAGVPAVAILGLDGNWHLQNPNACASGSASGTAGGDLSGSYPNPTVAKINGGSVPVSASILGTNALGQLVDSSAATLTNNTTGTASNITAASNSTLTSLPNLSIAYSQITGVPTGLAPSGAAGGDLGGSYPSPTVMGVNGAAIPTLKTIVGTDANGRIVDASSAVLANNTTGTAAGLSGTIPQGYVYAGPASGSGPAGWRALVASDIAGLIPSGGITVGTTAIALGGSATEIDGLSWLNRTTGTALMLGESSTTAIPSWCGNTGGNVCVYNQLDVGSNINANNLYLTGTFYGQLSASDKADGVLSNLTVGIAQKLYMTNIGASGQNYSIPYVGYQSNGYLVNNLLTSTGFLCETASNSTTPNAPAWCYADGTTLGFSSGTGSDTLSVLAIPCTSIADAGTINWAANNAPLVQNYVSLDTANGAARTLNVSGLVNGAFLNLKLVQVEGGVTTVALGTGCTWLKGGSTGYTAATSLTLGATGAGGIDVLSIAYDGANCLVNFQ